MGIFPLDLEFLLHIIDCIMLTLLQ